MREPLDAEAVVDIGLVKPPAVVVIGGDMPAVPPLAVVQAAFWPNWRSMSHVSWLTFDWIALAWLCSATFF